MNTTNTRKSNLRPFNIRRHLHTKDIILANYSLDSVYYAMLQDQFFIPADCIKFLQHAGWTIHPIKVMTNEQWLSLEKALRDAFSIIRYDPSREIVEVAQFVGVSLRTHEHKDAQVVVKLWYQQVCEDCETNGEQSKS